MKLTKRLLMKLINEEKAKLNETLELGMSHPSEAPKRTIEIDAKDMSKCLEKCVDYYKFCCLKEEKMIADLKKIQEIKEKLKAQMKKELNS